MALQAGVGQSGYNTSNIIMGDPTETLDVTSATYFTVATGIAWSFRPDNNMHLKLAMSGHNLNQPTLSYTGQTDGVIKRRFNVFSSVEYRTWPTVSLVPMAALTMQKSYREMIVGCDAKWYVNEYADRQLTLSAGLRYRWRDALMMQLAAEYNLLIVALTYDANISKLTPASKSIGAFELGVIYRIPLNSPRRYKALPCPIM